MQLLCHQMKNICIKILIFLFLFVSFDTIHAQSKEKIKYKADILENGTLKGRSYRKLIGNVVFTQQNTIVYCDTSYYFIEDNEMEAFSNVLIKDGDSVTINSKQLIYNGNNRTARLRNDVVYKSGNKRLFTDFLDYNLAGKVGTFFNFGRLKDIQNELSSDRGVFYAQKDSAIFFKDVVLIAPEYTLYADTLDYNTVTKIAHTKGPTKIITDDSTELNAIGGTYRTIVKQTDFIKGRVETNDYYLEADTLYFDEFTKYYQARGNVKLTAKNKDVIIIGEKGYYDRSKGESKIFEGPIMKRILELDTFYISSDTMVALDDPLEVNKRILAYYDVKMFRYNLQGIADSVAHFLSDSLIKLYDDPVIWNEQNQIEADSIDMYVSQTSIDRMDLKKNSFLTSMDTLQNFNQIKGREMIARFNQNMLETINVNGNCESNYYILGKGDSTLLGMNYILCSEMLIQLDSNEVSSFTCYNQPEAKFIPPHELSESEERLKGFNWRAFERPNLFDVVPYLAPEGWVSQQKKISGDLENRKQRPLSDEKKQLKYQERYNRKRKPN